MADPLDKLETAVRKLAADVGDIRKTHGDVLEHHSKVLDEHGEMLAELTTGVKQIQKTQLALTNAMTKAIKQLGIDKSLEIRVERLEGAVFGSKH